MVRVWSFCVLVWMLSGASGQSGDTQVTLGFSGEIVANAWNPLRVLLRDQGEAEFVLTLDRGNLRDGEQIVHYRAPLAGGGGLYVFEDDLYIPAWRRLTWAVRTPERVLASGSVDRRSVDPRPLHLLDSAAGLRSAAQESRTVDVHSGALPERSSAYAGVEALFAGEGASAQAVAAAAAAGTTVFLAEPLPEGLRRLAPRSAQRLGAGWLVRTEPGARMDPQAWPRLESTTLLTALLSPDMRRGPPNAPQQVVFLGASLYALAVFLIVRLGRVPGLFAGLSLAVLFATGAWGYLRPSDATLTRSRSLSLASGGLAQTLEGRTLFSLPEGTRQLALDAYPLELTAWESSPGQLRFRMPRWSAVVLAVAPRLEPAAFYWDGDQLVNSSPGPLGEVFVLGLGQQPNLASDEHLKAELRDSLPPAVYTPLLPHLPRGSALARSGGHIYVALPPAEATGQSGAETWLRAARTARVAEAVSR